MADYPYEHKTPQQFNIGWVQAFDMGVKAPAIAKRIFRTRSDAYDYAANRVDSAVAGVIMTVIQDPDDNNNGAYYIKTAPVTASEGPAEIEKICRGNCAWFQGNAVDRTHTTASVTNSKEGDIYFNPTDMDIFRLSGGTWTLIGNIGMQRVDNSETWYVLSCDGVSRPTFDTTTWTNTIPTDYSSIEADPSYRGQVFLWTRLWDPAATPADSSIKYTVSIVASSLNLGTFTL